MLDIKFKPVVNYTKGRKGYKPEAFVIHIAQGTLQGGYSWFNTPASKVSAHYMVSRDGTIWQFVKLEDTAWHAGGVASPTWKLLKPGVNPNLYTIGIEHEGFTGEPWTKAMYNATAELIGQISREWGIPVDRKHIIGHYQINSTGRANCPGSGVNLETLVNSALKFSEDPKVIAELQSKIKVLEKQLKGLNATIQDQQASIKMLTLQNKDLKNDLTKEIELLENKNKSLNTKLKDYDIILDRNIRLSNEVKKLQTTARKYSKRIAELEQMIKDLGGTP